MEKTAIQKAYDEIVQLNKEQPWSALIMKAVIQLKEIVDKQILDNFVMIYWEHWEETSAYQEFNTQAWLEKLENNLLKRELWIDTSIAKLLLATPWELASILQSAPAKNEESKIENENNTTIEDNSEDKWDKDSIKISKKENRFLAEDQLVDKYQWEKNEIAEFLEWNLEKWFSVEWHDSIENLSITYKWDELSYYVLVKLFLWKDYFKRNKSHTLKTYINLSSFLFPEKTLNYLNTIKNWIIQEVDWNTYSDNGSKRQSLIININWISYNYIDLVALFDAYVKSKGIYSDEVFEKLSVKLFWSNWRELNEISLKKVNEDTMEVEEHSDNPEQDWNEEINKEPSIEETSESEEASIDESSSEDTDEHNLLISKYPLLKTDPEKLKAAEGKSIDEIWEMVNEDLLKQFSGKPIYPKPYLSNLTIWEKDKLAVSDSVFRTLILNYLEKHKDLKLSLLTNKEFYAWNGTTNPIFMKSNLLLNVWWEDWNTCSSIIHFKDIVSKFGVKTWDKFTYGSNYENILLAVFWSEKLKEEREKLKDLIKESLEKKFKKQPEIEKYWFIESDRSKFSEENLNIADVFWVTVNWKQLTLRDISMWLWEPVADKSKVDFQKMVKLIYWEHEVLVRKEKLKWEKQKEEVLKNEGLIDFADETTNSENIQLSIDFDDSWKWIWTDFSEEELFDLYPYMINVEWIILNTAWVWTIKEFNKCYDQDNDAEVLMNIFMEASSKITKEMLDFYWDLRSWIDDENKKFIIESYKKYYPYADEELWKIFEDDNFFNFVKTKYTTEKTEEAMWWFYWNRADDDKDSLFFFYEALLNIFLDDMHYWDFMDFYVDEIKTAFQDSHNKNYPKWEEAEKQAPKKKTDNERAESLWISTECYNTIQSFLDSLPINLVPKKRKREISKFAQLIKNWEPFRIEDFCKIHDLNELSDESYSILNQLWLELNYRWNIMAKNEYVVKSAVQPTVESKTNTVEIEEKIEEEVVKLEKNKEKFKIDKEELLADITWSFINIAKHYWFGVFNEKLLKKQIEEYISVSKNRDYLVNTLLNDKSFWKPIKKKTVKRRKSQMKTKSNIYSLELQSWAWRFVVQPIWDTFFITELFNHATYDRVLKRKK